MMVPFFTTEELKLYLEGKVDEALKAEIEEQLIKKTRAA